MKRLAWVVCGLAILIAASRLGLAIVDPASSDADSAPNVPGGGVPLAAFEAVVLTALALTGGLVASRLPRNPVGWILCAIPVSLSLLILSAHLFWALALGASEPSATAKFFAWLASWIWIPGMVPALTLFPLLFPTGRPPTPRWRWVTWLVAAAMPLLFVGVAFAPGRFEDYPLDNPLGPGGALGTLVNVAGAVGFGLMIVAVLASAASLVVRFRRSRGVEREQLKWVTAAAVVFLALFAFPTENFAGDDVGFATLLVGLLVVALAVAFAILRHRLYDIGLVLNRALVYGALTATLGLAYLLTVLVLQGVLKPLTADSNLTVAGSTLVVAAIFRPARSRIQGVVDRRFFRRKYDAQRTLDDFRARLRMEVDLTAVTADLTTVVTDTMAPTHVSLWLRRPDALDVGR